MLQRTEVAKKAPYLSACLKSVGSPFVLTAKILSYKSIDYCNQISWRSSWIHSTGGGVSGRTSMGGQYPAFWFCQEAQPWHVWVPKEKRPGVPGSSSISSNLKLILLTNSTRDLPPLAQEPESLSCGAAWKWGIRLLSIAPWQKTKKRKKKRLKEENRRFNVAFQCYSRMLDVPDSQHSGSNHVTIQCTLMPVSHLTFKCLNKLNCSVQQQQFIRNVLWFGLADIYINIYIFFFSFLVWVKTFDKEKVSHRDVDDIIWNLLNFSEKRKVNRKKPLQY